ncbi:Prenyltransferase and squalene oxidase repeat-containing protein [Streptomyces zhaozhouensis]|uniref:Prenyltransferase and squalene oxidase repeat-containing protein n=1 Tax=Streptomyces zhaozhouensis TaxID=1300267 RepID=A0A286DNH6_9ACTN|nr:prenyltransferase/squalene oxidase repeat-containing protein [Streptomyces zhaozhouensis]SOD60173.1 Prenyltransferase and squalene oxidase repeat-containing protein [Streptomyces zhaozhouensis]
MFFPRSPLRGAPRGAASDPATARATARDKDSRPAFPPATVRAPAWTTRAALVAVASLTGTVALAPAVVADESPAPPPAQAPEGLFGDADPQYDGVWRQSYALLAQHTAGYTPGQEAVDWLVGQQCADGSFLSFRADPEQPCADVTASDSNATALAVQALAAVGGRQDAVDAGAAWLTGVQNEDGGWGINPGTASDANSTAVVIGALAASGHDPAAAERAGNSPYAALGALQLGCEAPDDQRGAFAWQPDPESGDLFGSDMATVDAVLAAYGSGLLVDPETPEAPVTPLDCGGGDADADAEDGVETDGSASETPEGEPLSPQARAGSAGAAQLVGALENGENHLQSTPPGGEPQPDFASTARAVLALAAGGHAQEATAPLEWLRAHHGEWDGYASDPTAVSLLVLAAHATGGTGEDFGGTDLLEQLGRLGPAPDSSPGDEDGSGEGDDADGGSSPLPWIIGIGLVAGIGVGVLLSFRRRASEEAAPDETAPDETAPDKTVADEAVADEAAPGNDGSAGSGGGNAEGPGEGGRRPGQP